MNFEKMSIFDIFYHNFASVISFTMIGITILIAGFAIRISVIKKLGNLFMCIGIVAIIAFNVIIVVNNQSKELMNGESTIDV